MMTALEEPREAGTLDPAGKRRDAIKHQRRLLYSHAARLERLAYKAIVLPKLDGVETPAELLRNKPLMQAMLDEFKIWLKSYSAFRAEWIPFPESRVTGGGESRAPGLPGDPHRAVWLLRSALHVGKKDREAGKEMLREGVAAALEARDRFQRPKGEGAK